MKLLAVALSGDPDGRPDGFPCFGCGAQVTEERSVEVSWPGGRRTQEAACGECAPRYQRPLPDVASGPWGAA